MTLNQAIHEYRKLTVIQALETNSDLLKQQKKELFSKVNELISSQTDLDVQDLFTATLLFSEMALTKTSQSAPLVAYYYGTMAQNDMSILEQNRIIALRYRLFALFQNLEIFNRFISLAHSVPMFGYTGSLTAKEFFDFLIMSDAYKVWDSDPDSKTLNSIKRQTILIKTMHTKFSREAIIYEGEKAHKVLFELIGHLLRKD